MRGYRHHILFIIVTLVAATSPALPHSAITKTIFHRLGETPVQIITEQFGPAGHTAYIHLHGDEETALSAGRNVLTEKGGLLIRIENPGKRNVRFMLKGHQYSFDPNRIFSRAGIEGSLRRSGRYSAAARKEVERFAARLISLLPKKITAVIALHNNTDGNSSVLSYLPGSEWSLDARSVYHNHSLDEDDFFYHRQHLVCKTPTGKIQYRMAAQPPGPKGWLIKYLLR